MEASAAETRIPARLDRLPWSRWHWLVVLGLGTVWILDGLEVTIVGTVAAVLTEEGSGLELSAGQVGQAAALYVSGACIGALFFARLTDMFGRKKLFMITLALYLAATIATAFSTSFLFFAAMRFLTGAGIGGEYAAINSAIDELIPARVRGTVDLIINGSFWLGTAFGAVLSVFLLNPDLFAVDVGWRVAFGSGFVLGVGVLIIRRFVPESPRWLFLHGRDEEAEAIVRDIEEQVKDSTGRRELPEAGDSIKVAQRGTIGLWKLARTIFADYRQRAIVGFSLFIGQAFLYNAVFFTYALVLSTFFGVEGPKVGYYILPFAVGNFLGPLVLGRLFDTVGRKPMIAGSYIVSGVLLIVTGLLFKADVFGAWGLTAAWSVIFFFASAGASSAYLTVSEIFPMETRAMSIALFYSVGTAAGGIIGPILFGKLVGVRGPEPGVLGLAAGLRADDRRRAGAGVPRREGGAARARGRGKAAERRGGRRRRGRRAGPRARPRAPLRARATASARAPARRCGRRGSPTASGRRRTPTSTARWTCWSLRSRPAARWDGAS